MTLSSTTFFSQFVEQVNYVPLSGSQVQIDSIVYRQDCVREDEYIISNATLTIDSGALVATPNPNGDTVFFDGFSWDLTGFRKSRKSVLLYVSRKEYISKRA